MIDYVEGYINTVSHKPKYPNNDRCLAGCGIGDSFGPIVPVGGSGAGGGSQGTPRWPKLSFLICRQRG